MTNIILVDWDNTLFHYSLLSTAISEALGKRYNIPSTTFYPEQQQNSKVNGRYTPEHHLYLVALISLEMQKDPLSDEEQVAIKERVHEMKELFDSVVHQESPNCLFHDSVYFLTKAQHLGDVRILSFGTIEWQQLKIDSSRLLNQMNLPVTITEDKQGKIQHIQQLLENPDNKVVFLNDNSTENFHLNESLADERFLLLELHRKGVNRSGAMFNEDIETIDSLDHDTLKRIEQFFTTKS